MSSLRFGFVTCVELGLACMEEIERSGGRLNLVITLEDNQATKKAGRVWVDDFCRRHGSSTVKVRSINDARAIAAIIDHKIDWLFIIGWSQVARADVLSAPRKGVLGMHPTLLPEGRGRAPIPWAILKGLPETGVTLFKLDEGIDTGPILAQERIQLSAEETATTLYQRVRKAHQHLIHRTWDALAEDRVSFVAQDENRATFWPARKPEDGLISPLMKVAEVDRLVRASTHPYPGAFWMCTDGSVLRIWAGRPIRGVASPQSTAGVLLTLADGYFEAVDYQADVR